MKVKTISDPETIRKKIIEEAYKAGFNLVGFANTADFGQRRKKIFRKAAEEGCLCGMEPEPVLQEAFLKRFKSVVSLGISYRHESTLPEESGRVFFSVSSWGRDYHKVVYERMSVLEKVLKECGAAETACCCDTGPVSDRETAVLAGLGWIGRNGNLINERYGSFIFLGEIFIDLELPADVPAENLCGECRLCMERCPGCAIDGSCLVKSPHCASWLTQKKGELSFEEEAVIRKAGYVYGCDRCQEVCPYNRGRYAFLEDFRPEKELVFPRADELLAVSNREFRRKWGHMSGAWRGAAVIRRNADILAEDKGGD